MTIKTEEKIHCDRCPASAVNDHADVIGPEGWLMLKVPTRTDLCPSCAASFHAWLNFIKANRPYDHIIKGLPPNATINRPQGQQSQ